MEPQEIFVDNLRHALQQLQRYLAFGFTSALMLLVLAASPPGSNTGAKPLPTPIGDFPVDPSLARILLIAICIGTGFLSYAAVLDARRLAGRITDASIRAAALSFPTVASSSDSAIRLLGPLAPAIVYGVFLLVDGLQASDPTFGRYLGLGLFGIGPYVGVAYEASTQLAPGTSPPTATAPASDEK